MTNETITPFSTDYLAIETSRGWRLFVVDGSRFYAVTEDVARHVQHFGKPPPDLIPQLERRGTGFIGDQEYDLLPLRSLSLIVAQNCNMACRYCYADKGRFGKRSMFMSVDTAKRSIDRFLALAPANADLVLGFMGGEPFLNRSVLCDSVVHADRIARRKSQRIRYAVTTNATRLTREDMAFLSDYPFTVTVSLDGEAAVNDHQRPLRNGDGSYILVCRALDRMNGLFRPEHISIRATVTPKFDHLLSTLEHLLGLYADSVGFSPVLDSPDPDYTFNQNEFKRFLSQMIQCGEAAKNAIMERRQYPFTNLETALHEIHRGSHRPFPCGAGAGYMSLSADGSYFACHRLIDHPSFAMGTLAEGIDDSARAEHLRNRRVEGQEPCASCWARYLCGGGCYCEVEQRGRLACIYVRGWLRFCLKTYAQMIDAVPDYFNDSEEFFKNTKEARNHV